jgi:hypothetical protein
MVDTPPLLSLHRRDGDMTYALVGEAVFNLRQPGGTDSSYIIKQHWLQYSDVGQVHPQPRERL